MSSLFVRRYGIVLRGRDLDDFLLAMGSTWFGAEDEGRTEDPTEHKIKKAREEGKVAKSADLTQSVVLLVSAIAIAASAGSFLSTCVDMIRHYLSQATESDPRASGQALAAFVDYFVRLVWPVLVAAFAGALIANFAQVGFLFTTKPLKPDFKKISPNLVKYFKRVMVSTEAVYNLGKSVVKLVIIGAIGFLNIQANIDKLANSLKLGFYGSLGLISDIALAMIVQATIVLLVLSVIDYWFQRRQHRESLKMTKKEVKEERKTYEGDPLIKNRMRQRMREILSQNIMREVPKADVVVTNPTHYAVALAYRAETMTAPTVVAKGVDALAQRIKQIAFENDVPVMENKPLARALYAEVELGDSIPQEYYEAVVTVFKEIYRMRRKKEAV